MIKILIVDDHPIVRDGLKIALESVNDFEIVGAVTSGSEALKILKVNAVDVLLSDVSMPEMNGMQLVKEAKKISKDLKVLFLSMHENEAYIKSAIDSGANGYLLKDSEKSELETAIFKVYNGETFFGKSVSKLLAETESETIGNTLAKKEESILSQRELEVLYLIAQGFSNKEIAVKLFISNRTVDAHRYNIMQKMNVKNTAELIKNAVKLKLVEF
ncbi:MAG: response regulator [Bacteroidota bacterium]|jgi:DNA-binding NarL/FixJ family response regulator